MTRGLRRPALAGLALLAAALAPTRAEAQRRCRVSEVIITPPEATVRQGSTHPFVAYAYDAAGNPCESATFTWTSSNPRAAAVSADGIATAVGLGLTEVRAATGVGTARRVGTATLTVTAGGPSPFPQTDPPPGARGSARRPQDRQPAGDGPAEAIVIDPLRLQLVRGESRWLDYRAVKGDGSNAAPVPLTFAVEPGGERFAYIDSVGLVTALADVGTATVRVSVPGQPRIQPRMVVIEVRGDSVTFNRRELSLTPGTVDTLSIFIPAQQRAMNPTGVFQFVSMDPTKVRVNPVQPIVEALAPGRARVVAQSSVFPELAVLVNVHQRVAALDLRPTDSLVTIAIGGALPVQVRALAADSAPVPEAPLRWTMPDSAVVAFDTTTRTLRGRRVGQTTLLVSAPLARDTVITRTMRIRVVAGSLRASRTRLGLPYGGRAGIEVHLLDDTRQSIGPATQLTWTSTADSVATMQGTTVVAGRPGRARLTGRTPWDSTVTVDVTVVGDMLFTAQREGRFDLMQWWDGQVAPLTRDSALETFAAWSPDLTSVAYARAARPSATEYELWVMNADGTEPRQLTRDSAVVKSVSWLPNGEALVYESNRGGSSQLWMIRADGTNNRQLTPGPTPNTTPSVSPDGAKVIFVGSEQTSPGRTVYGIYERNLDGTGSSRGLLAAPRVSQPRYTPDGTAILFLRDEGSGRQTTRRVYRLRVGQPADSMTALTPATAVVTSFAQSADGQSLACTVVEVQQGNVQASRVAVFNLGTSTFQPLAGVAPEERLSNPALRPGPTAAAGGTSPPR